MIIVTGGAGFIGSKFVEKLNQEGKNDIIIVDSLSTSSKWKNLIGLSFKDYLDKKTLLASPVLNDKIEAIVHMGACSSTTERNLDYLMENNFKYTKSLAELCVAKKIRFIYASSAATYGLGEHGYVDDQSLIPKLRPLNPYGFSKQLFDLWALDTGAINSIAGLKFFNVYGPNEYHKAGMTSMVYNSYRQIKASGRVRLFKSYKQEFRDGEQKRDFVSVFDCVSVMWWLLNNPQVNGIYNLSTGSARSWNDLACAVYAALNIHPRIEYIDMPEELKQQYQYFTEGSIEKLRKAGYKPEFQSLEDGVKEYVLEHLEKTSFD
jgi:ADP-L-glycero-D-manno-heptose 6-epimerase